MIKDSDGNKLSPKSLAYDILYDGLISAHEYWHEKANNYIEFNKVTEHETLEIQDQIDKLIASIEKRHFEVWLQKQD